MSMMLSMFQKTNRSTWLFLLVVWSLFRSLQTTVFKRSPLFQDFLSLAKEATVPVLQEEEPHVRPNHSYPFTFAACVICRDDNILLPEWLAYHYTVMPLRHLILAADPLSITSPVPSILKTYKQLLPDLTIDFWHGNSYFRDGKWSRTKFDLFDPYNHSKDHEYDMHIQRQNVFYTACLQKLKAQGNHTWVMIIDTDEYWTYNSILPTEHHPNFQKSPQAQPIGPMRSALPPKVGRQNETMAHFMANTANSSLIRPEAPCIVYPRLFFTANDNLTHSQVQEIQHKSVPDQVDVGIFHSLRYRYHWRVTERSNGKSLIHVGNYNGRTQVKSPHRPLAQKCDYFDVDFLQSEKYPFRIHHYSGSLESYLVRPSRTKVMWEKRNYYAMDDPRGRDDSLSDWYWRFSELVGHKVARKLTVDLRNVAFQEWEQIKYRVEVLNETNISFAFDYDRPQGDYQWR